MFLIWGITLRNRIVQIQAKRFMTSIAGLIVFWVAIRSVKFVIAQSPFAVRMLWYMYYIPMIFIPMFALLVALSLGKPENYRLPGVTSLLYVASVLMVIFVLTNDLHCLVFRFPGEREMWDDRDYSYAGGYYIVAGYMLLCTIGAFVTLISKCRIPKERKNVHYAVTACCRNGYLHVALCVRRNHGRYVHSQAGRRYDRYRKPSYCAFF